MKAKRKRRMSRRRRELTYIAVMVLLAIAVSIGLTRSVMRDDKEFEEYEQQSQEFNARMQRIDEKREASGQNAMLEQVRTWQQEQDTEPDKYAVFDTMSADWGGEEDGFVLYEIPEEYSRTGGYFPEKMQVYTYCVCKGKTERPDVAVILEPTNIQRHVKNVVEQLENTAPEGYDVPHPEKAWKPSRHGKVCINEGTSRKVRMIEKPRYNYEQVIHHIVVSACYDIFMKGMYEFSCGSVPNRGAHYGKKYIERWIQRDKKNCKYVLKMDIRHFFESVDHDVLKAWLKKKIRDERMLYILELIIDGSEVGLPLGFYTSQWLSNFMLQPLDHFIKEQLKAVHYIRYMDDMVVFGKNKKELHRMQQEIERFLREKFNLQMKGNWQVFRFDYTEKKTGKRKGRPLDFMGFQFYHDKTILRESIMLSCTRKVNRVAKKEKITWYDATAILSYMGYLSNTDTYDMYLQRVKPYVNVKKLKKIVSKHSKRKEREKHERMERSVRNGGRTAGGVRHNSITDNGISETQYQESNERGCRRKENHRMAARGA